ncbi:hypothetical protein ENC19_26965 [Verrucosispora sp. CWR15]|uniref:MacB-like periplasmic core domain-containing protein n=1 Tax=Verrucosispora sioxanthis TaxID=2499994 RepID=A0A6M1LCU7_9ACTN|nr:hypothetical protein [Verrucosispora sioxanthis]NEE66901.1 hypothetical protein [Verrucosispora sioxanthis]NGM16011.1 hypothetical protein [Verrucosispora sioxanthis]
MQRRWYAASLDEEHLFAVGDEPPMDGGARKMFGLRAQTGVAEAAELTAGRWRTRPGGPAEVVVSGAVAETLSLRAGQRLRFAGRDGQADARIVGVFEPRDAGDPVWDDLGYALEPVVPVLDGEPYVVAGVTDWVGVDVVAAGSGVAAVSGWRYRLDERRLNAATLESVTAAVAEARRMSWSSGATVQTSLDGALSRFAGQLRAVQALPRWCRRGWSPASSADRAGGAVDGAAAT